MRRTLSICLFAIAALVVFASTAVASPFDQFHSADPEDLGYPVVDGGFVYRLVWSKRAPEGPTKLVRRDLHSGRERTLYTLDSPFFSDAVEAGGGRVAIPVKTWTSSARILVFDSSGVRSTIAKTSKQLPNGVCRRTLNLGPISPDGTVTWQRVHILKTRSKSGNRCGIYANRARIDTFARSPNGSVRKLLPTEETSESDYESLSSEGHESSLLAMAGNNVLYTSNSYEATMKNIASGAKKKYSSVFQESATHVSLRADGGLIHPSNSGAPVVRIPGANPFMLPATYIPPIAKFCGDRIVQASDADPDNNAAAEVVLRDERGNLVRTLDTDSDPHLGEVKFVSCDADFAAVGHSASHGLKVELFDLRG